MARRRSPTLTDAELRLMEVLWQRGSGTVNEVLGALPEDQSLAYSTVLTILRILEQKGYVRHEKKGRAFVYAPVVNRGQARRRAVRHLISRFFEDSPELLVLSVLEHEEIDAVEMKRLREMVEKGE